MYLLTLLSCSADFQHKNWEPKTPQEYPYTSNCVPTAYVLCASWPPPCDFHRLKTLAEAGHWISDAFVNPFVVLEWGLTEMLWDPIISSRHAHLLWKEEFGFYQKISTSLLIFNFQTHALQLQHTHLYDYIFLKLWILFTLLFQVLWFSKNNAK